MYDMPGWALGFGFGGGIFMILWWVLVIVAIVALVRWLTSSQPRGGAQGGALDILARRYASGEISREEYERMRSDILRPAPPH
jgi:putative membrane protein